ncbi:muB [Reptilian orthoreovirus]|uniref:MuB n=1 Tax=chelonian orthoreovirus TaxID=3071237 RepID=A0A1D7PVH2_9REOV|nr:muB [Reptilian orthoreovirus]AOM63689.1 muB [chelonian orthoreovirus]
MGNASSIVQNFNITGDGNSFAPTADQTSSAVPTLSLEPGLLNPGGLAYKLVDPTKEPTDPGALALLTTKDLPELAITDTTNAGGILPVSSMYIDQKPEKLTVVTDHALEQMRKNESAIEISRAYLSQIAVMPQSTFFMDYVVQIKGCYVGTSATQAARSYVSNPYVITKTRMSTYMTVMATASNALSKWSRAVTEVANLIPTTTPFGKTECDMRSVVKFLDEVLPEDHLARDYPEEMADNLAKINGGIRWKDETTGDVPSLAINDVAAPTMAIMANTMPLAEKSETTKDSLALMNDADVDLMSCDRPISSTVWARVVNPKSYNIRVIPLESSLWLRTAASGADFIVSWTPPDTSVTHYIKIMHGARVINLEQTGTMTFNVDLEGKNYKTTDFNPNGQTVGLVVMQSKVPFEQWTAASMITGVTMVASEVLVANDSSTAGASIIGKTSLTYIFERETITVADTEVNTYLFCGFIVDATPTTATYPWYDTWDAQTTLTPMTTGTVTINGATVDEVNPTSLIGAYTPSALNSALPNDAGIIMTDRAEKLAKAIKNEDDTIMDEASTYSMPILGVLALQNATSRASISPSSLLKTASRAFQMFLGNPQSILDMTTPVMRDPSVWRALAQGVRDGIRNKSLTSGIRSIYDKVSATKSVQKWKQGLLTQIQTLYPPSGE